MHLSLNYSGAVPVGPIWPIEFAACGTGLVSDDASVQRVQPYPIRLVNWFVSK